MTKDKNTKKEPRKVKVYSAGKKVFVTDEESHKKDQKKTTEKLGASKAS